jgi:subtilisin family serine protease
MCAILAVVAIAGASATSASRAGTISPELERALNHRGTHADVTVIAHFLNPLDLQSLTNSDRSQRDNRVLLALKVHAKDNLEAIAPLLREMQATKIKDLWMSNAIAVTVPAFQIKTLAAHRQIARVEPDSFVQGGRPQRTPPSRSAGRASELVVSDDSAVVNALPITPSALRSARVGWNIAAVHAPDVWRRGYSGQGVVVASMDAGADLAHPDLRSKWRGGTNSWFDPHGEEATPYDATGHGTQALGVMVGGPEIGVAPNARWISARLFNGQGRASMSDIHLAFQWLLDPDGDPATIDAPDVVNASWALTGRGTGKCSLEFNDDIRVLRSAGIAVVFAAGNDGPMADTSNSPGNNPGVVSVGAIDRDMEVGRQTSRGPSACTGSAFPTLMAPGVQVRTADLSHGGQLSYTTTSGSSLAAPHASGVLALLAGAFPSASVTQLETALEQGANERRIDALAAFEVLQATLRNASSGASPND